MVKPPFSSVHSKSKCFTVQRPKFDVSTSISCLHFSSCWSNQSFCWLSVCVDNIPNHLPLGDVPKQKNHQKVCSFTNHLSLPGCLVKSTTSTRPVSRFPSRSQRGSRPGPRAVGPEVALHPIEIPIRAAEVALAGKVPDVWPWFPIQISYISIYI